MDSKEMNTISVIIPVYNNEKFLDRCMSSILNQTIVCYEILLIDDGSTDKSGEICDCYAKEHPNIKVFHIENSGPAHARKFGVEKSTGNYIFFIDSDDYIAKNMLEKLYAIVKDFDIVCSHFAEVKNGELVKKPLFKEKQLDFYDNDMIICNYFVTRYLNGAVWGKLIKKELFEGVDYCENAMIGEDICLMLQLYMKANRIRSLSDDMYFYFQNNEGISRGGYTERHKYGLLNYIKIREKLANEYPDYRTEIISYFLEFEMAVLTAMSRNEVYNQEIITLLRQDLKKNMVPFLKNKYTAVYLKASGLLMVLNYKIFCYIFKRIRRKFGK